MSRAARRHPERFRGRDVFIAYVRGDFPVGITMDNLLDTVLNDRDYNSPPRIGMRASMVSGPRIASARNVLVRSFLNTTCEWLWFIDMDQTWHFETFQRALSILDEGEIKFLSGLTYIGGRHSELRPSMYSKDGLNRDHYLPPIMRYPKDALIKVAATGAFWSFVHRDVYLAVGDPWYSEIERDGAEVGEDLVFCERAMNAGYTPHVHTGLQIGHMKMSPLTEWEFDRQREMDDQARKEATVAFERGMGLVP